MNPFSYNYLKHILSLEITRRKKIGPRSPSSLYGYIFVCAIKCNRQAVISALLLSITIFPTFVISRKVTSYGNCNKINISCINITNLVIMICVCTDAFSKMTTSAIALVSGALLGMTITKARCTAKFIFFVNVS